MKKISCRVFLLYNGMVFDEIHGDLWGEQQFHMQILIVNNFIRYFLT